MKKENIVLKQIRIIRGISLVDFARMLEISISYLCMIEKGDRDLSKNLVTKVHKILPDLSLNEKHDLNVILERNLRGDLEKTQKHVLNLITQYFYRVKNGIKEGLEDLFNEIIELIKKFKEEEFLEEMVLFKT